MMWKSATCLFALLGFIQGTFAGLPNMRCVADVALLVDKSGSITDRNEGGHPDNWRILKDFLFSIFDSVDYGDDGIYFASLFFANNANIKIWFDTCDTVQCMKDIIETVGAPSGRTNTDAALREAMNEIFNRNRGDRPDVRDIVLMITDGKPNPHDEQALNATVKEAKARGIRIIGVGVGQGVDHALMREIVTAPYQTHYFQVEEYSKISNMLDFIIQQTCLTIPPPATTPVMTTTAPAKLCKEGVDLVFLIDKSGSIGSAKFEVIKNFLSSLIQDIPVEASNIKIATVTFSDNSQIIFDLNKHTTRVNMVKDVMEMMYTGGATNTASAIRRVREDIFSARRGDRPDWPNVAVIITDGNSRDKRRTLEEAVRLKEKAHVIVIQVGNWVDDFELNAIATAPHSRNKIEIADFDALFTIKSLIQDLVCKNQDNCENVTCLNGGTCVNDINDYHCECVEGFAGKDCQDPCRMPADIIFAIDKSGSISHKNFEKELDFVKSVVDGLNFKMHRVGVMSFSTNTKVEFHLDKYDNKKDIITNLDLYYSGGTTNLAAAFQDIRNRMFTDGRVRKDKNDNDVPRVIVVVTDGRSNNEKRTWEEAVRLKNKGITILAVGIGNRVRESELRAIVSDPADSNVFRVEDFDELVNITTTIGGAVCNKDNECEENPCQNGGTCTDKIGGKECECPEGFSGPECQRPCDGKIDLGIIIDSSGSIRSERFPYVIDYITKVVGNITTGRNAARVGAVSWSTNSRLEFPFDRYFYKNDIVMAIQQIGFVGDRTNTYSALLDTRTRLYRDGGGEREDAADYVIMFTDGGSNINADRTIREAVRLKEKGIHVTIVAVGDDMNPYELQGMASDPTFMNILWTLSYTGLPGLIDRAWSSTCNSVNECESNPCQNGGTCEDGDMMYMCVCPNNFIGVNCGMRCSRQMDVVFVLDISGSVDTVYNLLINFTKHAVMGLPMHFGRTRVGLISYSDRAKMEFDLNDYTEKKEILNAMVVAKPGGATNTQAALRMMHQDMFSNYRGDRDGVDNVAIVISDGMSNVEQGRTKIEAERAHNKDISIYSVAAGDEADMREINDIASDPDSDYVVLLPSAKDIPQAAEELMEKLCNA